MCRYVNVCLVHVCLRIFLIVGAHECNKYAVFNHHITFQMKASVICLCFSIFIIFLNCFSRKLAALEATASKHAHAPAPAGDSLSKKQIADAIATEVTGVCVCMIVISP